ncbi:MAG: aminotransferase class V-fold PLP-dependent enzyme, partial [Longimicrobiales bacterium]
MTSDSVVYFDYAATCAIRPRNVIDAMTKFLTNNGCTPGRGGHCLAIDADRIALHCRQSLAAVLDIPGDTGRIAFFPNATYALNTALNGLLRSGD